MYLVLSAFTSSPISLVAATKASAFSYTTYNILRNNCDPYIELHDESA